jgi:hypothetical protein
MRKQIGWVLFGAALLAAPMTASAVSPWANEMTYGQKVTAKLKYGLTNTLLGWTSLVRTPVQASQAGENFFVSIWQGVWNAVGQTGGGALHAATFFLPQVDLPLPEGGTDILSGGAL